MIVQIIDETDMTDWYDDIVNHLLLRSHDDTEYSKTTA